MNGSTESFDGIFAVDPAESKPLSVTDVEGRRTFEYKGSLRAFIEEYEPRRVYVESMFHNFDVAERNALVQDYPDLLVVSPTRATRRIREQWGAEKADFVDSMAIAHFAREAERGQRHGKVATTVTQDASPGVAMRRGRYKNADALRLRALLQEASPPERVIRVLWTGKTAKSQPQNLALSIALLAEEVVADGGGRTEFDRRCGTYEHGYPSLVRSNIMHHRVPAVARQYGWNGEKRKDGEYWKEERKAALRDLRFASRWIFAAVRQASGAEALAA